MREDCDESFHSPCLKLKILDSLIISARLGTETGNLHAVFTQVDLACLIISPQKLQGLFRRCGLFFLHVKNK